MLLRALFLLVSLGVCARAAPVQAYSPDVERSSTTSAVVGQRLTLRLNNRVQSGRVWYMLNSPEPELSYVGQRFERPAVDLPDVAQAQIFEFLPKRAGTKLLRFAYGAGPGKPVLRVLNVRVSITGGS